LPPTYTWQRVKDLVRDAGFNVLHTDMIEAGLGVAVAQLSNHEEVAAAASELSGRDVEGHSIHARPEEEDVGAFNSAREPPHPPPGRNSSHGRGGYHGNRDNNNYGGGRYHYDSHGYNNHDRKNGHSGAYDSREGGGYHENPWDQRRRGSAYTGSGHGHRQDRHEPWDEPPSRGTKRPQHASEVSEDRRLFAENLALGLNWRQLKDFFRGYGVVHADVIEIENEAFGIVEFETRADASEACMQFNGVILEGKAARLRQDRGEFEAMWARKRPRTGHEADAHQRPSSRSMQEPPQQAYDDRSQRRGDDGGGPGPGRRPGGGPRVYVGNLDFRTSWQDLKDHMRQAGNVKFCDVLKDGEGGPKGCALVEYSTKEECDHALKTLNDTSLGQRQIYVKMAREDDRR